VTLRIKRRKNTTKTINTGIETQAKDRIAVNREIAVCAAMKVITLNEIMETLNIVKVGWR
jgi:quinolinate synthase